MNKSGKGFMKLITGILLVTLFSLLSPGDVVGQDINTKISQAIKASNSSELSKYFNNSIDLTIPGSEGTYSKVQAEQIIRSFFVKYPPVSFTINHKGNSNDGSIYAIGTYNSSTKSFRTYYLAKPIEKQLLIHQLKFELKED